MRYLKAVLPLFGCLVIISVVVFLSAGADLIQAQQQGAKIQPDLKLNKAVIISITSDDLTLRPITINSGTPVVWLNNSRRIMTIEFTGKQVTMACDSPTNFYINEQGTFISNKIIINATASLCFIEKGEYTYDVVFRSYQGQDPWTRRTFKGKIIVQ